MKKFFFAGIIFGMLWAGEAGAALQDCVLTWNANTEADLSGYHVYAQNKGPGQYVKGQYQGTAAKEQTSINCSALGLTIPGVYNFVLTAFDTSANESGFSNEVNKTLAEIPVVGAPGAIIDFSVTPGVTRGTVTVALTIPDDGTGKPATVDVRYQEGKVMAWGSANAFPCFAFPCTLIGLKDGTTYTLRAIPVRRAPGVPSVFGAFTADMSATTLPDDPPINPPPTEPRKLEISVIEKDGLIIMSLKKEDFIK